MSNNNNQTNEEQIQTNKYTFKTKLKIDLANFKYFNNGTLNVYYNGTVKEIDSLLNQPEQEYNYSTITQTDFDVSKEDKIIFLQPLKLSYKNIPLHFLPSPVDNNTDFVIK
jgi:hypothetical protein